MTPAGLIAALIALVCMLLIVVGIMGIFLMATRSALRRARAEHERVFQDYVEERTDELAARRKPTRPRPPSWATDVAPLDQKDRPRGFPRRRDYVKRFGPGGW